MLTHRIYENDALVYVFMMKASIFFPLIDSLPFMTFAGGGGVVAGEGRAIHVGFLEGHYDPYLLIPDMLNN